jgi:hypothetical protein
MMPKKVRHDFYEGILNLCGPKIAGFEISKARRKKVPRQS